VLNATFRGELVGSSFEAYIYKLAQQGYTPAIWKLEYAVAGQEMCVLLPPSPVSALTVAASVLLTATAQVQATKAA
jgi:hypothetical protein